MENDPSDKISHFATTRWSLIIDAVSEGDEQAASGLAALCEIYWLPLYRYLRRTEKSSQDAEDLVQGFFATLLEKNGLRLADQEQGRFRAFLLGSLKNYAAKQWRKDHQLKRGGFTEHLSIDWESAEEGLKFEPSHQLSPDKLFDRDWALTLLEKVLDDLSAEEGDHFTQWKDYLSIQGDHIPYHDLARESGMTQGAIRVAVHRLRKLYRRRLKMEIARTLTDPAKVDQEFQSLIAALRGE
jgi:RNA polymerase sigma factor (sigma-70 family)